MKQIQTLSAGDDGVLTMTYIDSLLYMGCVSGTINLWDLDTMQLIRSVRAHQTDVLSLSGIGGFAFSGSARGYLKKWDLSYSPQRESLTKVVDSNVLINGALIPESSSAAPLAGSDLSQAETIIILQSGTSLPASRKNKRKRPVHSTYQKFQLTTKISFSAPCPSSSVSRPSLAQHLTLKNVAVAQRS